MRTLESAIITLSSSSGRGGQKSCTHFGGQEHSPLPFFCEGRPNNCQRAKKNKEQTQQQTVLFSRRFVSEGQDQQQRATFRLNLKGGWRPFQPRKKRLEEEHHYYYVTRGQERDAASTHNNKKKKKKVSLLPTHQTRYPHDMRRIVVVAVVSCEKHFDRLLFQKKV